MLYSFVAEIAIATGFSSCGNYVPIMLRSPLYKHRIIPTEINICDDKIMTVLSFFFDIDYRKNPN